jgi:hypothetical protein
VGWCPAGGLENRRSTVISGAGWSNCSGITSAAAQVAQRSWTGPGDAQMSDRQDRPLIDPIVAAGWYIDIANHLAGELARMPDLDRRTVRIARIRELHERISRLLEPTTGAEAGTARLREQLRELETFLRAQGCIR